ncbi:MAG: inner membrane complex domain-containing protein, partial [Candidatus Nanohaloarchaea archaeon]|nr:inner membrane complex domain-containing protein [Candidatus Nanohaloarchaea archaeon]
RLIQDLKSELEREKARAERLKARNEKLKRALDRMEEGWIRVPEVESLEDPGDDTVFVERYDGGPISERVETVVTRDPSGELKEAGVEVLDVEEIDRMVELEDSLVIHPDEFERAEEPERFMEWLESYRER